ncbi:MAG: DNA polymerase I [Blautia sp.]|nr:DNA polymerase I [Blautia sp.]
MKGKILLIDGHSILNRAFYGLPDLTNTEGKHTGAVYGFLNIFFRILEEEKPDYVTVAFDLKAPTFRHRIYEAYKGTRKGMPEELREQVPLIKEMLKAMRVNMMTLEGYEADDLLGTVAKRSEANGLAVTILSGDRDLLQLVTDKILLRIPKTVKGKTTIEDYYPPQVAEKYGVTPIQIIELKALMGDASDNIPGLPGVGEKTAAKIIAEFGTIENAYAHLEEIKPNKAKESMRQHYEQAQLSKMLAAIETDCPLEFSYTAAECQNMFTKGAFELCKKLEFKNFLGRFDAQTAEESNQALDVFRCEDITGAEALFEKASRQERAGIAFLSENGNTYGISLVLNRDEIYYIPASEAVTGEYLGNKASELARTTELDALDVKQLLKAAEKLSPQMVFDTAVAAYLLNPLKSSYTYDDLAKIYLNGMLLPVKEDLIGKDSYKKAWEQDKEELGTLAAYMAYVAYETRDVLIKTLQDEGMWRVYDEIERPLIFTLDAMEKWGIRVQAQELKEYGEKLALRIDETEEVIYEQAGERFNINSPKQLGVILFEKLKLPGGKKTKTGFSTAADILEKLSEDHPIVQSILEYRQLTKLKSTYADGLANYIGKDGRIHSNFNQTITATGRISSTEPNLQNIPVRMELGRLIRKVFVPAEGFVFLDADYSQIELRVLAHMSEDEKLIQAYQEAQDIHRITASQVFHVPFEQVTALQRRNAKAVNFGIVYGISSFGLSQDLSISRKEAAHYIESYFETYPGIKAFLDRLVEEGKELGYVTTLFGRRRPIPELRSSNFVQRSFGERVAMNSPIQGTAADIIKIAMNRVQERLLQGNYRSRLILQVHDELLVEAAVDEVDTVSAILEEEMRQAAMLSVDLEVDMHQGKNWYEAK